MNSKNRSNLIIGLIGVMSFGIAGAFVATPAGFAQLFNANTESSEELVTQQPIQDQQQTGQQQDNQQIGQFDDNDNDEGVRALW